MNRSVDWVGRWVPKIRQQINGSRELKQKRLFDGNGHEQPPEFGNSFYPLDTELKGGWNCFRQVKIY